MGWSQTEYGVDEDGGGAVVCATVEEGCVIPFQFNVTVRTVDRTGMLSCMCIIILLTTFLFS